MSFLSQNGSYDLSGLILKGYPGSNYTFTFSTTGIDTSKVQ